MDMQDRIQADSSIQTRTRTPQRLGVGDLAPDFEAQTQTGALVRLSDYLGKQEVILYFYPKDNAAGCVAEACEFRDRYELIEDLGAEVIGVSVDSPLSHKVFAQRYHLQFPLLTDERGEIRKLYGVPASFGFLPGRVTYVIDKQGVIRHAYSSQLNTDRHVADALKSLRAIRAEEE